jgi:hypothetical protein
MPEPTNKPKDYGKILHSWEFPEYMQYKRTRVWYIVMGIIAVALLVWAIWSNNFLFAIIVIIISLIFIFQERRKPMNIKLNIREDGLEIGRNFYSYRDLNNFWIIYQPPEVKKIYVSFKSRIAAPLVISLENQNPLKIRKTLLEYLPEDLEKEEEPASDSLSRTFKI